MTRPYAYTVDEAVLEVFAQTTRRQRDKLLRTFALLANDPSSAGESIQYDHVGRALQVRRFGDWTVTYWSEHLASQVHIIAIENLRS